MATATRPRKSHEKVTAFVSRKQPMLINGKWVQAASGKTFAVYDPATGEVLSNVAEGDREDIDRAVNIVKTGRPDGGTAPDFLAGVCSPAADCIDSNYSTFGPPDFSRSGRTIRIRVRVDFPLTMFGFIGGDRASIPFVVVEDLRYVGV